VFSLYAVKKMLGRKERRHLRRQTGKWEYGRQAGRVQ